MRLPGLALAALLARVTTGGGVTRIAFGDTIVWLAETPLMPRVRVPLPPDE